MKTESRQITGVAAAGVPFVAVPPSSGANGSAPIVVAWHLMDPPRTEVAFAAALPLDGLDAWRIYLGLPLSGSRTPAGGAEELQRLGYSDAVMNLQGPVTDQAAEEFEPALADLRDRLDLGDGPVGVLGGSVGAAVAQLVIVECDVDIRAAVLVSPLVQLCPAVEAMARQYDVTYDWSDASLEVARRLDFVARAEEIARRGQPAVQLLVGDDDDPRGFREPAEQLHDALARRYTDPRRVELTVITGMGHALADEPGVDPAPQSAQAAEVSKRAFLFLQRHLCAQGTEQNR